MDKNDLKAIPKAEIHCHIEGAVPPTLALQQAARYGIDIANIVDENGYIWSDFTTFLGVYDTVAALFRTRDDYAALAYAYLAELHEANTLYSEFFISTDHAERTGLDAAAYIDGLAAGMARAEAEFGIVSRMIATGLRHEGPAAVMRAARYITENPHPMVTGWGMAGDERMYHPRDFTNAFALVRDAGLGITVHAGELVGAQSVADALSWLKPDRIGHGVRAIEDKKLVDRLARDGIVLECCPGSNIALSVFEDFAHHPLSDLSAAGVAVTLNSDDPPHFHTSLAREYEVAAKECGFDRSALLTCTRTAIKAGFLDQPTKDKLLAKAH